jgi:hypothetical protein
LESRILNRTMPAGGLDELRDAVLVEYDWARGVRAGCIDDTAYHRYLQVLFAALYLFSPNGRKSGVEDIKYGQAKELLEKGFATSTKFKTNKKYGYQPVTVGPVSRELVRMYVEVVRPQIRAASISAPTDPLWLTYWGEAECDIGRMVTAFFVRTCGLSLTITAIRSLVETSMHRKFKEGKINEKQRTAVQNINGHTSETTRDYYLLEERVEDVHHANAAFGTDFGLIVRDLSEDITILDAVALPVPVQHLPIPLPLPLPLPALHTPSAAPRGPTVRGGARHPDFGTTKTTAQWTQEEKQFLGTWCAQYQARYPEVKNVVANCLHHILRTPAVHAIFHDYHTLNSARLRAGWRQFQNDCVREAKLKDLRFGVQSEPVDETYY